MKTLRNILAFLVVSFLMTTTFGTLTSCKKEEEVKPTTNLYLCQHLMDEWVVIQKEYKIQVDNYAAGNCYTVPTNTTSFCVECKAKMDKSQHLQDSLSKLMIANNCFK